MMDRVLDQSSNSYSVTETQDGGGNGEPLLKHFTYLENSLRIAIRQKQLDGA